MGCYFTHYVRQVSSEWSSGVGLRPERGQDRGCPGSPTGDGNAGLAGGYLDAVEIKTRIDSGQIEVRTGARLSPSFEEVLDLYGLHHGDKAVVRLALQMTEVEATVTDDRLLWVVLRRCGHAALFLPDFIEKVVAEGAFDAATGQQLLMALRARLPVGFVEHSLRRLEGVL